MRKQILDSNGAAPGDAPASPTLDIPALATALVSSEDPDHPVENAFDGRCGPGASRWVAAAPGEASLTLAFDTPQTIQRVILEIEEQALERTQALTLAVSSDGGHSYRELLRQEYTFSPSGATFEREDWAIGAAGVTHLRVAIRPDKSGRPCHASLTTLSLS